MKTIRNRLPAATYQRGQGVVAGLVLTGPEVRAIRDGHVSLAGSYVRAEGGELWLINLQLHSDGLDNNSTRHKLLVTAGQLRQLEATSRSPGQTIVPVELQLGRYIKVLVVPGRGRRKADRRQLLRQRDQTREIARRLKR